MNTALDQAITQLTELSQKNSLGFARAFGAISREFGAISQIETLRMSPDSQRANEAGTAMAHLKAECSAICATIPPLRLGAIRALVGNDEILIAQRFAAIEGRPVPGAGLGKGK